MKEMEKLLARVCWTKISGTVLGEGQCLYFPEFPFPESICKYRCRGKTSFYFFFFFHGSQLTLLQKHSKNSPKLSFLIHFL